MHCRWSIYGFQIALHVDLYDGSELFHAVPLVAGSDNIKNKISIILTRIRRLMLNVIKYFFMHHNFYCIHRWYQFKPIYHFAKNHNTIGDKKILNSYQWEIENSDYKLKK